MARVRLTMEQVAASKDIDRAKVASTTEEDIQRHMVEDGEEPDEPTLAPSNDAILPLQIRATTGLSQVAFAKAVGVPVSTWRNWEQSRTRIDPAGRALLKLLADDPNRGLQILRTSPLDGS